MTVSDSETEHHQKKPATAKRETVARRAFVLWMAGYAVALALLGSLYVFGGGNAVDPIATGSIHVQQARTIGEPQSSLVERLLASRDSNG
jgi:hypothetical protein